MADLLPSLAIGLLPLLGVKPAKNDGFGDWLINGTYQLNVSSSSNSVELAQINLEQLIEFITFDFERFALASRESFLVACAERDQFNLAGWPLLKLYYAAFFGAHAIMRSQGDGVIFLGTDQANHLNSISQLIAGGQSCVQAGGVYRYLLDSPNPGARPSLHLMNTNVRGGVHEAFWKLFCQFLGEASENAASSKLANASEFLAGASEVVRAVEGDRSIGRVWLSTMRNNINYRHMYKTWFPVTRKGEPLRSLEYSKGMQSKSVRLDLSAIKQPVITFANTARYLACLSAEISEYVAQRSTVGGAFGQKWRRLADQQ